MYVCVCCVPTGDYCLAHFNQKACTCSAVAVSSSASSSITIVSQPLNPIHLPGEMHKKEHRFFCLHCVENNAV